MTSDPDFRIYCRTEGARLRREAEKFSDPDFYACAAAFFEEGGMPLAAARCRERAEYYRKEKAEAHEAATA